MGQIHFIVIQGKCSSGKTHTVRMVFEKLLSYASKVKFLDNR